METASVSRAASRAHTFGSAPARERHRRVAPGRGGVGGAATSARAAVAALIAMACIAAASLRVDTYVASVRASASAVDASASMASSAAAKAVGADGDATAALSSFEEDLAVEPELTIGDTSVAYVAKGWNAERRLIGENKIEAIWEGPAATNANGELTATKPRGVLLALHGCKHSAKDFFANNTKCTECRGLAQEMAITRTALSRRFVVIAISSFGTCWSRDVDGPRVDEVLETFFSDDALKDLPLYAFGASSGGSFVSELPFITHVTQIAGLIIQIAPGPRLSEMTPTSDLARYPPTVFSHMPRDERTAEFVKMSIEDLRFAGVKVLESKLNPRAITPQYFYKESFGKISTTESEALRGSLKSFNLIDKDDLLTEDPRAFDTIHVDMLATHAPAWDTMLPDMSDVRELLNVAHATHELSAQDFAANLAWLIRAHNAHT